MVCPSGALRATKSVPTTESAPVRGSITTCCFQRSMRCGRSTRAERSLLPPSENGMTMRTGLPGKACAKAEAAEKSSTASIAM